MYKRQIANTLKQDEADQVIYSSVVNFLVPFAISEYGKAPLATYDISAEDAPSKDKPFVFELKMCIRDRDRFASVQALKNAFMQASRIYEDSAAGIRKEPVLFGEQVAKAESKNKTHAKNYASVLYNQISAFMERVPTWIGRIWNVALILFWLLIVAASIAAVLSPNEFDSTPVSYTHLGMVSSSNENDGY